jgi:hypothetical protein
MARGFKGVCSWLPCPRKRNGPSARGRLRPSWSGVIMCTVWNGTYIKFQSRRWFPRESGGSVLASAFPKDAG